MCHCGRGEWGSVEDSFAQHSCFAANNYLKAELLTQNLPIARERNRAIDRAMTCLSNVDKASYTADILSRKSNRAMRAGQVKTTDAQIHLLALDLSDEVDAFRRECSICCGEGIMSIALKKLDHSTVEEKTTDFALNFPLAAGCAARNVGMVSSQCICFQCATCALLCRNSIYKENLAAILPTVVRSDFFLCEIVNL